MKIKAIRGYMKECLAISGVKFIIVPFSIASLAYGLGIGEINNGLALKVIIILSAMPPAFTSLIPPQLYKLDVDLANSSWLVNTGLLILVVPLLYFFVGGI
jgi:predicted permease